MLQNAKKRKSKRFASDTESREYCWDPDDERTSKFALEQHAEVNDGRRLRNLHRDLEGEYRLHRPYLEEVFIRRTLGGTVSNVSPFRQGAGFFLL